jgi:hypothetical protein
LLTAEDIPIYRIQTVSALTGISAKPIRRWDGLVHAAGQKADLVFTPPETSKCDGTSVGSWRKRA